jgi:hypothetical protein
MSTREELIRWVETMSEEDAMRVLAFVRHLPTFKEKPVSMERLARAIADPSWGQPKEGGMSFDEALGYTNENFNTALRNLAK